MFIPSLLNFPVYIYISFVLLFIIFQFSLPGSFLTVDFIMPQHHNPLIGKFYVVQKRISPIFLRLESCEKSSRVIPWLQMWSDKNVAKFHRLEKNERKQQVYSIIDQEYKQADRQSVAFEICYLFFFFFPSSISTRDLLAC